jgi:hypothetical protein
LLAVGTLPPVQFAPMLQSLLTGFAQLTEPSGAALSPSCEETRFDVMAIHPGGRIDQSFAKAAGPFRQRQAIPAGEARALREN